MFDELVRATGEYFDIMKQSDGHSLSPVPAGTSQEREEIFEAQNIRLSQAYVSSLFFYDEENSCV